MKGLLGILCFILSLSACLTDSKKSGPPSVLNATTVTNFTVNSSNSADGQQPVLNVTTVTNSPVNASNDSVSVGPPITDSPNTPTPPPSINTTTIIPPTTSTTKTTTTTTTTTTTSKPTTTTTTTLAPTTQSTTTVSTTTTTTTSKPTTTSSPPHKNERKFDGPSFVGGMILALGLVGIGFVAFKFYKARTELNYHTLRNPIENNFQI